MHSRQRKLIGATIILVFVTLYALVAMAVSQVRPLREASSAVQGIFYGIIGLAWILPLFPLIRWMESVKADRR